MWQGRKKRFFHVNKEPSKYGGADEVGAGSLGETNAHKMCAYLHMH